MRTWVLIALALKCAFADIAAKCPENGFLHISSQTHTCYISPTQPTLNEACRALQTYLKSCENTHGYALSYDESNHCCNTDAESCTTKSVTGSTKQAMCEDINNEIQKLDGDYAIVEVTCNNEGVRYAQWDTKTGCSNGASIPSIVANSEYYIGKMKMDEKKEMWLYVAAACFCAAVFLVIANKFL